MLAFPALHGQDPQKDDKPPATARAKFNALVKELTAEQQKLRPEITKAKGDERKMLIEKYNGLAKEYAGKIYAIAEENPKDPAAVDATFWVVQNGTGTPAHGKAYVKLKTLIAELPVKDLARRMTTLRIADPAYLTAVLDRAKKEADDPQAADLLATVATAGGNHPASRTAIDLLIEKHSDHAALERVARSITARTPGAEATLRKLAEKATKPAVKATAAASLARVLAARTDTLGDRPDEADRVAAEAEKFFEQAIAIFGKDNETLSKQIEGELKALRTLRVGKLTPEITAEDLDGKEFKLSDYRGKVVLLDFWGHW
jgi:hypothetical protein